MANFGWPFFLVETTNSYKNIDFLNLTDLLIFYKLFKNNPIFFNQKPTLITLGSLNKPIKGSPFFK
jgi:hypothetical protein